MSYALAVNSSEAQQRQAHYRTVVEQWSASLYDLDEHATYRLLAAGDMSGVTGDRANAIVASAPVLWTWLGVLRTRVEEVDEVVANSGLFTKNAAQIADLLNGQTILLSHLAVPDGVKPDVRSHFLDSTGDAVDHVTNCDGLIELFRDVYNPVRSIVADIDAVWRDLMPRIDAATSTLERAKAVSERLGVTIPEVRLATQRLEAVRASVSDDPLSLSAKVGPALDDLVAAAARAVGTLEHAHGSLNEDLASADVLLADLRVLRARAAAAYSEADAKVIPVGRLVRVPSTAVIDGKNGLAHRARQFDALDQYLDWRDARRVVDEWRTAADRLRQQLERALEVNAAPIAERADMRALLRAYQVKASMISDLPADIVELGHEAHAELYTAPTDLGRARTLMDQFASGMTAYGGRS